MAALKSLVQAPVASVANRSPYAGRLSIRASAIQCHKINPITPRIASVGCGRRFHLLPHRPLPQTSHPVQQRMVAAWASQTTVDSEKEVDDRIPVTVRGEAGRGASKVAFTWQDMTGGWHPGEDCTLLLSGDVRSHILRSSSSPSRHSFMWPCLFPLTYLVDLLLLPHMLCHSPPPSSSFR